MPFSAFAFSVDLADVNRFAHRYRAAHSFRGINLDDYSDGTKEGYSGLFLVLMMWSAFEQFLKVIGQNQSTYTPPSAYDPEKLLADVRAIPSSEGFYALVDQKATGPTKAQTALFMSGGSPNVTYLASSIRHIFVHGFLTPNANQSNPTEVATICNLICDFHMSVMSQEFKSRVSAVI